MHEKRRRLHANAGPTQHEGNSSSYCRSPPPSSSPDDRRLAHEARARDVDAHCVFAIVEDGGVVWWGSRRQSQRRSFEGALVCLLRRPLSLSLSLSLSHSTLPPPPKTPSLLPSPFLPRRAHRGPAGSRRSPGRAAARRRPSGRGCPPRSRRARSWQAGRRAPATNAARGRSPAAAAAAAAASRPLSLLTLTPRCGRRRGRTALGSRNHSRRPLAAVWWWCCLRGGEA